MPTRREMMSTNERLMMLENYVIYLQREITDMYLSDDVVITLDEFIEREMNNGGDNNAETET